MMRSTEREQLLIDAGHFTHEIVKKMQDAKESAEFNRLDKVALRSTALMGSLARYYAPDDVRPSRLLASAAPTGFPPEQGVA